MADPHLIDPRPDGPLKVSGAIVLSNSRGEAIETAAEYWLCRCGGSANKPFCDGTHKRIGFSGARLAEPDQRGTRSYAGKELTIHDNRAICAHAGHCTAHSAEVFQQGSKPWIHADADAVARTIATIEMCPSGALAYSVDGVLQEPAARAPGIHITKDGPYAVVGGPALLGDAAPESKEHYTLCRCGQSKNKPFCDGTHASAGFKDEQN